MLIELDLKRVVRQSPDNDHRGLFLPQDKDYVRTSEMVKMIAQAHGKSIGLVKAFNPVLGMLSQRAQTIDKIFGNLVYGKNMSEYREHYRIRGLSESIAETGQRNRWIGDFY